MFNMFGEKNRFVFMAGGPEGLMSEAIAPFEQELGQNEKVDLGQIEQEAQKALDDKEQYALRDFENNSAEAVLLRDKKTELERAEMRIDGGANISEGGAPSAELSTEEEKQAVRDAEERFEARKTEYTSELAAAKQKAMESLRYLIAEVKSRREDAAKQAAEDMAADLEAGTEANPEKTEKSRERLISLKQAYLDFQQAMSGYFALERFENLDPNDDTLQMTAADIDGLATELENAFIDNGTGYYRGILEKTKSDDDTIRDTLNFYLKSTRADIPPELRDSAYQLLSMYDAKSKDALAACADDPGTIPELVDNGHMLNVAFTAQGEIFASPAYDALNKALDVIESGGEVGQELIDRSYIETPAPAVEEPAKVAKAPGKAKKAKVETTAESAEDPSEKYVAQLSAIVGEQVKPMAGMSTEELSKIQPEALQDKIHAKIGKMKAPPALRGTTIRAGNIAVEIGADGTPRVPSNQLGVMRDRWLAKRKEAESERVAEAPKAAPTKKKERIEVSPGALTTLASRIEGKAGTGSVVEIEGAINQALLVLANSAPDDVAALDGKTLKKSGVTVVIEGNRARVISVTPAYYRQHQKMLAGRFEADTGKRIA